MNLFAIALLVVISAALRAETQMIQKIPTEVLDAIPTQYDITAPESSDARSELTTLLNQCGSGVVKGAVSRTGKKLRNNCSFQVEMDELFFKPTKEKTGLLHDSESKYISGTSFYEPPQVADLPDSFDIRDLMKNGQPDLRNQNCGDCWAWSTHHGLELARAVHDQKVFDHSVQSVLSCSNEGSCAGGYMTAVDFLKYGLPLEADFPYAGTNKKCKYSSGQISTGWDGKVVATPYIGSSLTHSVAFKNTDGAFREGNKVRNMMAAMYKWKSPLVVTVAAYSISGDGIYNSCSAINSGGNHMVAIVGWETVNGKRIAHVWNSWGKSHGKDGVSRIQWECGDGKLNRGLGVEAKIVQYKAPCTPPNAAQPYLHETLAGNSVQVGAEQPLGTTCTWTPTAGLTNPNACVTTAKPTETTEYHLTAKNDCGTSSSMTMVHLWGQIVSRKQKEKVVTPFGEVDYK